MRLAGLALFAILASTTRASAQGADEFVVAGQAFALDGKFSDALVQFKRAHAIQPNAAHACMIGLAYLRLRKLPQSEVFLGTCRARATATDPLPPWMDDAETQLRDQLAASTMLELDIRVKPAEATVSVSFFDADETFAPRVIHLPLGVHVLEVRADGFTTANKRIEVTAAGRQTVEIELVRPATTVKVEPITKPPAVHEVVTPPDHAWSNRLLVGAGVATVGAVVLHVLAFGARGKLEDATTIAEYREHETAFDVERAASISLYGVAAIAGGIGLYLRLTARETRETRVDVGADLRGDAAFVTIGWTR